MEGFGNRGRLDESLLIDVLISRLSLALNTDEDLNTFEPLPKLTGSTRSWPECTATKVWRSY